MSATIGIGALESGGSGLEAEIDVHIPTLDDAALALVQRAHAVCLYSDATRGNMDVALRVV